MNSFLYNALASWEPREFSLVSESVLVEVETPSHKFTYVIAPVPRWSEFLCVVARDSFSAVMAADIIRYAQSIGRPGKTDLQVSSGFKTKGRKFDSVVVIKKEENGFNLEPELESQVCTAYPMFRCELNGSESAKMLDNMMHEGLELLDWNREPYPKIIGEFNNSQFASERMGLLSFEQAIKIIADMQGDSGSWLDTENFQNRNMRILWDNGSYAYELSGQRMHCEASDLRSIFTRFAYGA